MNQIIDDRNKAFNSLKSKRSSMSSEIEETRTSVLSRSLEHTDVSTRIFAKVPREFFLLKTFLKGTLGLVASTSGFGKSSKLKERTSSLRKRISDSSEDYRKIHSFN